MIPNSKTPKNFQELLEVKYGPLGQPRRDDFEEKSQRFIIAECLKVARKKAHLTQQQLANKLGTHKSYISRLENGQVDLSLATLFRVFEHGLGRTVRLEIL